MGIRGGARLLGNTRVGRGESVDFRDAFGVLVVIGQATNSFWFLGIGRGITEPAAGGILFGTIR